MQLVGGRLVEKNPCCAPLFLLLVDALCADGFIISFFLSFLVGLLLLSVCRVSPSPSLSQETHTSMSWSHGSCGCCDHGVPAFCVNYYCCPCVTQGKMWEAYDLPGGFPVGCCCTGCPCMCFVRMKVAEAHNISPWLDPISCCCPGLGFMQAANEAITKGKIQPLMAGSGAPPVTAVNP